jgi:hypothetical protein
MYVSVRMCLRGEGRQGKGESVCLSRTACVFLRSREEVRERRGSLWMGLCVSLCRREGGNERRRITEAGVCLCLCCMCTTGRRGVCFGRGREG